MGETIANICLLPATLILLGYYAVLTESHGRRYEIEKEAFLNKIENNLRRICSHDVNAISMRECQRFLNVDLNGAVNRSRNETKDVIWEFQEDDSSSNVEAGQDTQADDVRAREFSCESAPLRCATSDGVEFFLRKNSFVSRVCRGCVKDDSAEGGGTAGDVASKQTKSDDGGRYVHFTEKPVLVCRSAPDGGGEEEEEEDKLEFGDGEQRRSKIGGCDQTHMEHSSLLLRGNPINFRLLLAKTKHLRVLRFVISRFKTTCQRRFTIPCRHGKVTAWISDKLRCDGRMHCADAADEVGCHGGGVAGEGGGGGFGDENDEKHDDGEGNCVEFKDAARYALTRERPAAALNKKAESETRSAKKTMQTEKSFLLTYAEAEEILVRQKIFLILPSAVMLLTWIILRIVHYIKNSDSSDDIKVGVPPMEAENEEQAEETDEEGEEGQEEEEARTDAGLEVIDEDAA